MNAAKTKAPLGPLIIVSGPSGSGKSTLIRRLLQVCQLPLRLSISATTRPARPNETDTVDYFFWAEERFQRAIAAGEFLEFAQVHGQYYGTLVEEVTPYRERGIGVILDIDVQGARQVWAKVPDRTSIFVRTSTMAEYERRLRNRGSEDESAIQRRLEAAQLELSFAGEYPYQILNDDLEAATEQLSRIVERAFVQGA